MKREIKFRIKFENEKIFEYFTIEDLIYDWDYSEYLKDRKITSKDQYIGRKDIKGVEIYKGDIIKFYLCPFAEKFLKCHGLEIKKIKNDLSEVKILEGGGYYIELWVGGDYPYQHIFGIFPRSSFEVIGNVFENPELT